MTADLVTFPNAGDELAIEPDEPMLAIEPEPSGDVIAPVALMEVLPADFKLPALIKFIPNPALRAHADQAATYALGVKVEGAEGLQRADLALSALRATLKVIDEHLEEPISIANGLHKRLTSVRSEWQAQGSAAVKTVGNRIFLEQRRLETIAADERRAAQAEADRLAREAAQREAAAAEKAKAPAPIVEELKRQAETVTAPPIAAPAAVAPLRSSTTVTTWKARLAGTPGADDANPCTEALSPVQRLAAFHLVVNVAAQLARDLKLTLEPDYLAKCHGAPLAAIEISWSYLNKRAKADKSTLAIAGIEAFEEGSVRAKGSRSK